MEEIVILTDEFIGMVRNFFRGFVVFLVLIVLIAIFWMSFKEGITKKLHQIRTWLF